MVTPPRLVAALLVLLALLLSGCEGANSASADSAGAGSSTAGNGGPDPCNFDLGRLLPGTFTLIDRIKLEPSNPKDPNDDSACLAVYRFDAPRDVNSKFGPIHGAVFRRDRNRPMDLHGYVLNLPNGMYIGEHRISAKMMDAISELKDKDNNPISELVIWDTDEHNVALEASIFHWNGEKGSEENTYSLLGWFQGDGGVTVGTDKVTVLTRKAETRSQLADRRIYTPKNWVPTDPRSKDWRYLRPGSKEVRIDPDTIDVMSLTMPNDPAKAEYPEKLVLAFYENIMDTNKVQGWFKDKPTNLLKDIVNGAYGCPVESNLEQFVQNIESKDQGPLPAHLENVGDTPKSTVTATIVCVANGRVMRTKTVAWPVEWTRDGEKWMLKKPSTK